jgi:hypothetical protein
MYPTCALILGDSSCCVDTALMLPCPHHAVHSHHEDDVDMKEWSRSHRPELPHVGNRRAMQAHIQCNAMHARQACASASCASAGHRHRRWSLMITHLIHLMHLTHSMAIQEALVNLGSPDPLPACLPAYLPTYLPTCLSTWCRFPSSQHSSLVWWWTGVQVGLS